METKTTDEIIHEHSISDNCNVKWVRVSEELNWLSDVQQHGKNILDDNLKVIFYLNELMKHYCELSQSKGDDKSE